MKLYARNCIVKQITSKEANDFCNAYHKQGMCNGTKVAYGLYYEDELLQVETFGEPRIETQNRTIWHDWELLRECSKTDYQILGGKSKLLKAFERDNKPICLLSYCNESLGFDGHSYAACGFIKDHCTQDYWYEYNGEMIPRYRMQKNFKIRANGGKEPIQKTLEKYGKMYDSNLTEKENAANAGFVMVKGKGQATWTKTYSDFVGYIYDFELNGKHYVGQHTIYKDGKWDVQYNGSGVYWLKAVEKYGVKNIKKTVLKWYDDEYIMKKMEIHYIRKAAQIYGNENMYNLDYTTSATTHLWTLDERKLKTAKERQSEKMKLWWANMSTGEKAERIEKLVESNIGRDRTPSEESKEKNRIAHLGKKHTDEWKSAMSEMQKGHPAYNTAEGNRKHSETLKRRYAAGELIAYNKNPKKAEWYEKFKKDIGKSDSTFKRFWKEYKELEYEEALSKYLK